MGKTYITLLLVFVQFSCTSIKNCDLAIKNVEILNVETGEILSKKTILISNGRITNIINTTDRFKANEIVEGNGKLITPSFIDTHIHPSDVIGDYDNAPKILHADSLNIYRKRISDTYLPFGVTTVLTMGQSEKWLDPTNEWQKNHIDTLVDYYISGGAMISKDNRVPYFGHTEVVSPELARKKVIEYYNKGIKYIKIYYRMKEPEFSTVVNVADSLKMIVFGHIGDFNTDYLSLNYALNNKVSNIEHIPTLGNNFIVTEKERSNFLRKFQSEYGELNSEPRVIKYFLEQFRYIEENKQSEKAKFIELMKIKKATLSTTINRIYSQMEDSTNKTLSEKSKRNFELMMNFAKQLHNNGVELRIGTDMPNGGKALISELIILCKYGFSVSDVFKIATINGAKAMNLHKEIGSIQVGKKANLIIWNDSPFTDYNNFSTPITIIKDGKSIN